MAGKRSPVRISEPVSKGTLGSARTCLGRAGIGSIIIESLGVARGDKLGCGMPLKKSDFILYAFGGEP